MPAPVFENEAAPHSQPEERCRDSTCPHGGHADHAHRASGLIASGVHVQVCNPPFSPSLLAAHARVDDSALITRLIGIVLRLVKRIEICVDSIIQILLGQWVTMRVHGRARFLAPTNFMDLTVRQCSRMPGNAYRLVPFYALDIHKTLPRRHSEAQRPAPPDSARKRLCPFGSEPNRRLRAAQGMPAGAPGTARGAWSLHVSRQARIRAFPQGGRARRNASAGVR